MPDNTPLSLLVPQDIMLAYAKRVRALRIQFGITQKELAQRVGVAAGTIKRFEQTGEIQLRSLLGIALVLGRLDELADDGKHTSDGIGIPVKFPARQQFAREGQHEGEHQGDGG